MKRHIALFVLFFAVMTSHLFAQNHPDGVIYGWVEIGDRASGTHGHDIVVGQWKPTTHVVHPYNETILSHGEENLTYLWYFPNQQAPSVGQNIVHSI